MAMQEAKKGSRRPGSAEVKILILEKSRTILFSSGFVKKYNLTEHSHVRIGYDSETKEIGIEFCKDKADERLLKLSHTSSTAASCSIRPILNEFDLKIVNIFGVYQENAIRAEVPIDGFSKNGFVLNIELGA